MNFELPRQQEIALTTTFTLVMWMGCVVVGVAGMWMVSPPAKFIDAKPAVEATLLNVEVTKAALVPPMTIAQSAADVAPVPAPALLPEIASPAALAELQSLKPIAAVMVPSQPTQASATPATQAVLRPATRAAPSVAAQTAPIVQQLTLGQGEGRQPSPEYPREAVIARQEGTVVVRFAVSADGSVSDVRAVSSSPWPLLNQAAVRAVRETWRFSPGPPRLYEVRIWFQLRRDN